MAAPLGEGILRRERRRRQRFSLTEEKRADIVRRVLDQYRRDLDARSDDRAIRLERYAKYRQWRQGDTGWPWPGSSDQGVPDMMEASVRMQDTLHNAVMSARPFIVSRALSKEDKDKQDALDKLHDTQFFVEQEGERVIEEASESFCNDPAVTIFVPWVMERRKNVERREFDPIPDNMSPQEHFRTILNQQYAGATLEILDEEGWDWKVHPSEDPADDIRASFYTTARSVEMEVEAHPVVFDGPRVLVKSYDDVIHPPGVANLDIPSPSNPGGAPHVILRDYPTKDEIARLARKRGDDPPFYDLISKDDLDKLPGVRRSDDDQESEDQKDTFAGEDQSIAHGHAEDGTLTRLTCFDVFDIDGDGEAEDVIFWVIKETQTLLRVRLLTEMYPGHKPERPLAEASFLPVGGRRAGISLLEMTEPSHDFLKETVDQMVDNGTLANLPWFTYRAASNLNPETLRPGPGDGIPVNDVNADIKLMQWSSDSQSFWLNLMAMIRQQTERLTLQGDIQAGRVPIGGSSALRTLGGIQTLLSQGEARPERILRRFFKAWRRVVRMMHRLNRYYLPDEKRFTASGEILAEGDDPWLYVARSEINVDMEFDFHANVLNSSKQASQQALSTLMPVYISELALALGITKPDGVYRFLRDFGKAFGQDPMKYLSPPTPEADRERITADEAVLHLMDGVIPDGVPAEATAADHLQRLQEITEMDTFEAFPEEHIPLLRAYMQGVAQRVQMEQRQAQLAAAAQQFARQQGGNGPDGRVREPMQGNGQSIFQPNELMDESLPTAGGGANRQ